MNRRMKGMKLLLTFLFFHFSECHLKLAILPLGKEIVKQENSDLNLTCKVISVIHSTDRYDLSWKLPSRTKGITVYQKRDQLTVTIHKLRDDDSGQYVCKEATTSRTKKISVFVKSKRCHDRFFDCGGGFCIPKRYLCDGYTDCPASNDEISKLCGPDPCLDKILCDNRCIAKELCCDPEVDLNCTAHYMMPCCANAEPAHPPDECGDACELGNAFLYAFLGFACLLTIVCTTIFFLACLPNGPRRWDEVTFTRDEVDDFFFSSESDNFNHLDPDFVACDFYPDIGKPPPYTEQDDLLAPPPPYEEAAPPTGEQQPDNSVTTPV